jgi:hypothetical protein
MIVADLCLFDVGHDFVLFWSDVEGSFHLFPPVFLFLSEFISLRVFDCAGCFDDISLFLNGCDLF